VAYSLDIQFQVETRTPALLDTDVRIIRNSDSKKSKIRKSMLFDVSSATITSRI